MNKNYRYLLMLGHLFTDINQGALPAILPFLIASRGLGYASAATLILASSLVSSVVQPLFGYLGDKFSYPWIMSVGVALAGTGLAMVGFCESYWSICLAAAVSGLGVALFHPEGGKIANYVSGEKKGAGISVFAVGGNLGFALGPIIASVALSLWGLKGTVIFLVPTYAMAGFILLVLPKLRAITADTGIAKTAERADATPDDWGAFTRVTTVVICRSIVAYGLTTFIPLYFIGVFLQTKAEANINLTVFSMAGAAATLLGGQLADRFGFRRMIRVSFCALALCLFIFIQCRSSVAASVMVIFIALALSGPYSSMIAMGQSFLPNHIGFASGISLGLAVSVGGVFAPVIGKIGDTYGIMAAMYTVVGIAFLALSLTLLLPGHEKQPKAPAHCAKE